MGVPGRSKTKDAQGSASVANETKKRGNGAERSRAVRLEEVPLPVEGRARVVVAKLRPSVGEHVAIKRCEGDVLRVEANLVADGHDRVTAVLRYRRPGNALWTERPLTPCPNDLFRADLPLDAIGRWEFAVEGWV